MCGRFNITSDPLAKMLMEIVGLPYTGQDNFNLAPTETVPVLRTNADGNVELVPMRWWLTPFWAKELTTKYAMFNAKSETAHKSPAFKQAYLAKRCVVPITGFYEWCRQNNQKVPYFIVPESEQGLLLAGLWDAWKIPASQAQESDGLGAKACVSDGTLYSFTVLTTAANDAMQPIHHRQPVMLSVDEALQWLEVDTPTDELRYLFESRLPMALSAIPVSSHVNNARHKDERCVTPLGEPLSIAQSTQPGVTH